LEKYQKERDRERERDLFPGGVGFVDWQRRS